MRIFSPFRFRDVLDILFRFRVFILWVIILYSMLNIYACCLCGENWGVRQATQKCTLWAWLLPGKFKLRDGLLRGWERSVQWPWRNTWASTPQASVFTVSLQCLSCLKALGSRRLRTSLPCTFWSAGISCNSIESAPKANFLIQILSTLFKSSAFQSRSTFIKSKGAVMPKSQSRISAIYEMLISINPNSPCLYIQMLKTM